MKKLLFSTIFIILSNILFAQHVKIEGSKFKVSHGEMELYIDEDTCTYISVHTITKKEILKLDGDRDDKWHKESPFGPYKKDDYVHSGYDLGHLTPAHITSYNDSLQYHSFSFFNQSPQVAQFNRGKWKELEGQVENYLIKAKMDKAVIITGVLYDNKNKEYLGKGRIKIPLAYYKIVLVNNEVLCWIGSNNNGVITKTTLKEILDVAKINNNHLNIIPLK